MSWDDTGVIYTLHNASAFRLPSAAAALPQPYYVGHATMVAHYDWSQQERMPGHGVCMVTRSGHGLVEDADGVHRVAAGDALLFEAGDPACVYRTDPALRDGWEYDVFFFVGVAASAMQRDLVARFGHRYRIGVDHPFAKRLAELNARREPVIAMTLSQGAALVWDGLAALLAAAEATTASGPSAELVRAAEGWIAARAGVDVGVAELARALAVSREHLSRCFREQRGVTVREHLARARLNEACRLLRDRPLTAAEVAGRVGYGDVAAFHRAFRQAFGITPDRWRRRERGPFACDR